MCTYLARGSRGLSGGSRVRPKSDAFTSTSDEEVRLGGREGGFRCRFPEHSVGPQGLISRAERGRERAGSETATGRDDGNIRLVSAVYILSRRARSSYIALSFLVVSVQFLLATDGAGKARWTGGRGPGESGKGGTRRCSPVVALCIERSTGSSFASCYKSDPPPPCMHPVGPRAPPTLPCRRRNDLTLSLGHPPSRVRLALMRYI